MKLLTERTEIAKAMNFGKYPVLTLNMEDHDGFEDTTYCIGCNVRVAFDTKNHGQLHTEGHIYLEGGKVCISNNAVCIHSDFGYSDVMEMVKWANTPMLHAGQEVVVVFDWPTEKGCVVRMMRVGERIDPHCMTVTTLEDID